MSPKCFRTENKTFISLRSCYNSPFPVQQTIFHFLHHKNIYEANIANIMGFMKSDRQYHLHYPGVTHVLITENDMKI